MNVWVCRVMEYEACNLCYAIFIFFVRMYLNGWLRACFRCSRKSFSVTPFLGEHLVTWGLPTVHNCGNTNFHVSVSKLFKHRRKKWHQGTVVLGPGRLQTDVTVMLTAAKYIKHSFPDTSVFPYVNFWYVSAFHLLLRMLSFLLCCNLPSCFYACICI